MAERKQRLCFCFPAAERSSSGRRAGAPSVHSAGVKHSRGSFQTVKVAALPHPTLAASAPHSGLALQRGFGIIPEIPTYAVFLQPRQQFYELFSTL